MSGTRTLKVEIVGDGAKAVAALGRVESKADGFGSKLLGVGKAVGLAMGAAGLAVGGTLFKIGSDFDEAYDAIRVGTGATGEALNKLQKDFKQVVKGVPTDFASAGTAVADLNTRLGLTGKELQIRSKQFLELSRITGTDLSTNIESLTRVFGDWGVVGDKQTDTMNQMFRASQATGIGIDQLAQQVVQFGAPLRGLGLGFETSIGLLSKWEKEGVNTELVLAAMKKAFGSFAKEGKDAPKAFAAFIEEVQKAPSASKAAEIAIERLGVRNGPDFAAAVQEGRFALGDLLQTITMGQETIIQAGEDTQDFAEKWQMIKNRVFVALQPVATKLFSALGDGVDRLIPLAEQFFAEWGPVFRDIVRGALAGLADWWERNGPVITQTAKVIATGVKTMGEALVTAAQFIVRNWETIGPVLKGIAVVITTVMIPHWIALGVKATASAAKTVTAWVVGHATAVKKGALHSAELMKQVAGWAAKGAAATASAAKQVAAWTVTAAVAVKKAAVHAAEAAVVVAKWAWMGVQALTHAAKVAAAWLISMGPIAIVGAAVVALAALVIRNWETIRNAITTAATAVLDFLRANWPTILAVIAGPFGLAVLAITGHWTTIKGAFLTGARFVAGKFLDMVQTVLGGAARAFGWVPGIGPKLKAAAAKFAEFRDDVNKALGGIKDKEVKVTLKGSGTREENPDFMGPLPSGKSKSGGSKKGGSRAQMRAHGGPVRAGMPYIVGELRPELFVPDTNGTMLPSVPDRLHGVSLSTDIKVTVNGAGASEEVAERVAKRVVDEFERRVVVGIRAGAGRLRR